MEKSRHVDIPLFAGILNMVVDCSLDMLQIWNMRRKCKILSRNQKADKEKKNKEMSSPYRSNEFLL
ncbi:hypothetical protein Hdeb2414_s0013g00404341 [Helianthus debilis subsp. tardiflorus]